MRTITSSVETAASVEAIWEVLTGDHTGWDPHITTIEGKFQEGERLSARFANGMRFKPTVTKIVEGSVVEWLGSMGFKGIFDGRHRWELELLSDGRVRITQGETFTGILVPLMGRLLRKTADDFDASTMALAATAEARDGT